MVPRLHSRSGTVFQRKTRVMFNKCISVLVLVLVISITPMTAYMKATLAVAAQIDAKCLHRFARQLLHSNARDLQRDYELI